MLALSAYAAFTAAQAPAQKGPSLVTVSFRAVTSEGQPVLDLAPEDVTVKLDGRAREVQALQLVRFERGPGSAGDAPAQPYPRVMLGELPIESLPPGDYLVSAIVSLDGQEVGRVTRTLRKARR